MTVYLPGVSGAVHGVNGQVAFDGAFVIISRQGAIARMTIGKGEKRIPIGAVTSVQWKSPGLVRGFISFTLAGANEKQSRFGRQSTDAAKDENSVLVSRGQEQDFLAIKAAIEQAIAQRYAPSAPVQAAVAAPQGPPPGWYASPDGGTRWWDGTAWTDIGSRRPVLGSQGLASSVDRRRRAHPGAAAGEPRFAGGVR